MSFGLAAPAFAAAAIAKVPQSLRQTYHDGSSTELQCDRADDIYVCRFKIDDGRTLGTYSFHVALRRMVFLAGSYAFWDHGDGDYTLALDVNCDERELALIPDELEFSATCRVRFKPQDAELVPQDVDIVAYNNEKDFRATLDLRAQGEKWVPPPSLLSP
ncbi:MAG: hypothetical protein HOQ32_18135 [Lysobacter sp.]|nr:hypothetical protein [Lysobacter sp.]